MSGGSRDNYSGKLSRDYGSLIADRPRYDSAPKDAAELRRREDEARRIEKERETAESNRRRRLAENRARIDAGETPVDASRNVREVYDRSMIRSSITKPSDKAKRVHVVLVDNSGSNREIADHLMKSSGYFLATLGAIDPQSEVAFVYFSDHRDDDLLMQEVDFVGNDEMGDKVLHSTIAETKQANGHDAAEAIECALWRACDIDFGNVQERYLYLVSDEVGHGMGEPDDDGCPQRRNWRDSLKRVAKTYRGFRVVGSGNNANVAKLQEQFITDKARLGFDYVNLASVKSHKHRCGITGNSVLFLIARERGPQVLQMFLMALYEKWLSEPIFGQDTDLGAKEAITRFAKYVETDEKTTEAMLSKVFGYG